MEVFRISTLILQKLKGQLINELRIIYLIYNVMFQQLFHNNSNLNNLIYSIFILYQLLHLIPIKMLLNNHYTLKIQDILHK